MILWVKSVPQHHLSSHTGHYNRTEVARSEVGGEVLLFAERWAGNPGFHPTPLQEPREESSIRPTARALHGMLCAGREAAPCRRLQQGSLRRGSCARERWGHITAPQPSAESWPDCLHHHTPHTHPARCLLGMAANAHMSPDFGGNHLWLFHKSEFSK